MTLHADALACNLATRLGACSHDELRVLDVILSRLEKGRVDYGPLVLDGDPRVWRDEAAEELVDLAIYDACDRLARRDEERAELHAAAAAEISSTRAAGGNADHLPRVAARVDTIYQCDWCGSMRAMAMGGCITLCGDCCARFDIPVRDSKSHEHLSDDSSVVDDPDATMPRPRFDVSDTGGEA